MVVERLSTLLAVVLLPPEYPQRWRDRDLSSWMDWKVLEVPVLCLGMVPVGLCLTGLLAVLTVPVSFLQLYLVLRAHPSTSPHKVHQVCRNMNIYIESIHI